jgi:hypothetical protein
VREAAALLPGPLLRALPFGPDAAEMLPAAGGGAVLSKVAGPSGYGSPGSGSDSSGSGSSGKDDVSGSDD